MVDAQAKKERDEKVLIARKSGLSDDLDDYRDQVAELTTALPRKKIELEALNQEKALFREETMRQQEELARVEAEVAQLDETVTRLTQGNPVARAALDQIRDQIAEQEDLTAQNNLELRGYEKETSHLRDHYSSILKGLEADAEDAPWITIGKRVPTQIQRLSMETGMLVLPLGTTHGMREKMRFFVSKKGKRVGQLVIKEAGLAHSVANIVPLIGNPTKLREQDDVEITSF